MKKSIIVIALALLALVSVFAADTKSVSGKIEKGSNNSVSTQVVLTLDKTPDYAFGITSKAFSASDISSGDASKTAITHNTKVTFQRDKTNVLKVNSISSYYLSYFFYEYDGVTLTMSVDGNLKNTTTTYTDANKAYYEIPYTITVAANGQSDHTQETSGSDKSWSADTTINSKNGDVDGNRFSVSYDATDKLGQYRWASLQLTFAPETTEKTLEGIAAGSYLSTVTLKVEAK